MTFLIDGYNLLHAVGFAPGPNTARKAFDAARTRFLDWLATSAPLRNGKDDYHVVFDAQNAPVNLGGSNHRGIRVTFSYRQTADDLIETLIANSDRRTDVCVVTNDGRLREAALHGGCQWMNCNEFLDRLLDKPATSAKTAKPKPGVVEKPNPTAEELVELLRAFQQPKLK